LNKIYNMKILINSDIDREKWEQILNSSPFSSPFQTMAFYEFFNSIDNFSADVFAVEEGSEITSLVVVTIQKEKGIKGFFSRRGIIYGGPLVLDRKSMSIEFLLGKVKSFYSNKLIFLEIRNFHDYSNYRASLEKLGFKYISWLNFHLDIHEKSIMLKNMSESRARQIKKAINNGVVWREAKNSGEVIAFYNILSKLYKNKIKKPLLPKSFFLEFFRQNIGKILLVIFDEKVIGGIMSLILQGKAIYEFYVCGLDKEYKNLYPSVMATWAAIEYAAQYNIPLFDFMGAGSPIEDYGVRDFKSRFGGRQVEHGRYLKILNPLLYNIGKMGLKVLENLRK